MIIYYTVGETEKKVLLKDTVKNEFRTYLDQIVSTGLKLPIVAKNADLDSVKLKNIRSNRSSGNKEMLQKLLSTYHYVLFPNEPKEEEILKPIVIEAIRDIVGEELTDKIARVEKENLEFYRILMRQQAKLDEMERKLKEK